MDVLTDVLDTLRLKSSVYYRSDIATVNWSLHFKPTRGAMFHMLDRGSCYVTVEGSDPVLLQQGDLVVLPAGSAHHISDRPGLPAMISIQLDRDYPVYHAQRYGEGEARTTLICGLFDFEHQNRYPLFTLMPSLIHILREHSRSSGLESTLCLIAHESRLQQPGTTTLLRRLSDVLFVQMVRLWMDDPTQITRGWFKALRDPAIGQALSLIHAAPATAWTVERLAKEVAMSRSAFAACFSELMGEGPFQYLTRWRMQTALKLMENPQQSLTQVAEQVGYESSAAFHRAFKRYFGTNPGAYRRANITPAPSWPS